MADDRHQTGPVNWNSDKFMDLFDLLDLGATGMLSANQVQDYFERYQKRHVPLWVVRGALNKVSGDEDNEESVSRDQFAELIGEVEKRARRVDMIKWEIEIFRESEAHAGQLSVPRAHTVFKDILKESYSEEKWQELLSSCDIANTGAEFISFEEFARYICDI